MKTKWLIGGLAGLVIVLMGATWVKDQWAARLESSETEVLIAHAYLPIGTILEKSHVDVVKIPKPYVQPGALTRKTDVIGQVTTSQIAEGEQMLANKISESAPSVSSAIPFGRRAFTLPMEASAGLGGLIKPGDMVDVLATVEGTEGQRDVMQTTTIIQHVKVIAVGSRFRPAFHETRPKKSSEDFERMASAEPLTVAVTAQEAELLAFAEQRGRLKVVVRSVGDAETTSSRLVNFGALMKGVSAAQKPAAPAPTPTQIIQGLDDEDRRR